MKRRRKKEQEAQGKHGPHLLSMIWFGFNTLPVNVLLNYGIHELLRSRKSKSTSTVPFLEALIIWAMELPVEQLFVTS